ncbi:ankyrin repeat-containing domain protein [Lasiosphaeria miniovina]|uniref:Ankyrin repeat-containing domain protein n=1 Tax=Lasiosphaeria miniovina TaxID=1954250 RepID=A0AA40AB22_9PEZI|nr:ankyrin repeat-containing domain protein [Lasiosphaeria miniovina]KAK0712571.1 ankyrin repeat-containing domain protein [Lasiosphaeria miniovina]
MTDRSRHFPTPFRTGIATRRSSSRSTPPALTQAGPSGTTAASGPGTESKRFLDLPAEAVYNIAHHLDEKDDLGAFAAANRDIYKLLREPLYKFHRQYALAWGVRHGRLDIVRYALRMGADVNKAYLCRPAKMKFGKNEGTTLSGRTWSRMRKNLSRATIWEEWYPIHMAVETGNLEMVQLLVEKGASLRSYWTRRVGKRAAKLWAREPMDHFHDMLIASYRPLHTALALGYDDIAKFLIDTSPQIKRVAGWVANDDVFEDGIDEKDGDENRGGEFGCAFDTAFHVAARFGRADMLQYIADKTTVNVNIQQAHHGSAFGAVAEGGREFGARLCIPVLIGLGVRIDCEPSPLLTACELGNFEAAVALLRHGASIDCPTWTRGEPGPGTPSILHFCARASVSRDNQYAQREFIREADRRGADHSNYYRGFTPLGEAFRRSDAVAMDELMSFVGVDTEQPFRVETPDGDPQDTPETIVEAILEEVMNPAYINPNYILPFDEIAPPADEPSGLIFRRDFALPLMLKYLADTGQLSPAAQRLVPRLLREAANRWGDNDRIFLGDRPNPTPYTFRSNVSNDSQCTEVLPGHEARRIHNELKALMFNGTRGADGDGDSGVASGSSDESDGD